MKYELLRVDGYNGRKIPCLQAANGNDKIAVLFPGYSYGTEAPFYTDNLLIIVCDTF